jgi:predicted membrane channel-forming protein YqfA (hemolysin III family)
MAPTEVSNGLASFLDLPSVVPQMPKASSAGNMRDVILIYIFISKLIQLVACSLPNHTCPDDGVRH